MTVNAQTMLELAEAIHKARWPEDRQMNITPFADEDKNGRDYCFRIARAVAALRPDNNEWIDQNYQIDRYGVALMMIREGYTDPAGLARRILSEFTVTQESK